MTDTFMGECNNSPYFYLRRKDVTSTQLKVTEDEYDNGSSAQCTCGVTNYFLVDLKNVTLRWQCSSCGEENYHPDYQMARKRIEELEQQLNDAKLDLTNHKGLNDGKVWIDS
jgi:hypothetical protein